MVILLTLNEMVSLSGSKSLIQTTDSTRKLFPSPLEAVRAFSAVFKILLESGFSSN